MISEATLILRLRPPDTAGRVPQPIAWDLKASVIGWKFGRPKRKTPTPG